ncbi:MAG: hypothetical protein JW751_29875 [Polyangiaceae bacterium]|nr:hypothetical protein [Polyangiaceae bacterium]
MKSVVIVGAGPPGSAAVLAMGTPCTGRDRFTNFAERRLVDRACQAEQLGQIVGYLAASSVRPRQVNGPGSLAAGEVARRVDAATAEAIYHALVRGTLAGESANEGLAAGGAPGKVGERYAQRLRARLGTRMAGGAALTQLLRTVALDSALRLRGLRAVENRPERAFVGSLRG